MTDIVAWREQEADRLVAEGNAARDHGDIETAADRWSEAHDVRRGHADPEVPAP